MSSTASPSHAGARGLALAVLLMIPLGAAPAARAADPPARGALADTTKPVMFLKETLVTGARYPRAFYESPQSLSFVTHRQLTEAAPLVVGDVLERIPGVDNSKDSPWEQRPVLRGLSGQRVLVLVDGTPMNSARGNGPHPSLVAPDQIERIEVVRGPASVAYGSDALGGVINIITREPLAASNGGGLHGGVTLGGSVAGLPQRNGSLWASGGSGKLGLLAAGGGSGTDDYRNADGTVHNSGFSDWNALAKLRYDFTERLALKGGYEVYRGARIGIPGLSFGFPGFSESFEFKDYDRDYAHLGLEHAYPGSGWLADSRLNAYWQREHRNFFSDQDAAFYLFDAFGVPDRAGASSGRTQQDRLFDLDTYGLQAQMTSTRTHGLRFSAGADLARDLTGGDNRQLTSYRDSTGAPAGPDTVVASASVPTGRFDSYAGYVQGELALGPKWTLDVGGRFTHYRYRTDYTRMSPGFALDPRHLDDDALSGSVGLVFAPIPDLHLSANVANGYREPNAQDLYFSGPASVGFVIGNPALKPERSVSWDFGLRWGPGDLALSGNLFYSTFDDIIEALSVAPPPEANGAPTYQYTNIATARTYGGELEAEWRFHPQWLARVGMSGTIGDVTSRSAIQQIYGIDAGVVPLEDVPPIGGNASLRWTEPGSRLWVEVGGRTSWRTDRLPPPIPGVGQFSQFKKEWIVGDLSLGARLPHEHRVVVGVRNVADLRYQRALASVVDPGRTFFATLSGTF